MIELKELSHEERIHLARTSEPFFLKYRRTKQFTSVFNQITDLISDLTTHPTSYYTKEIWTLISAVTQCIRYNNKSIQFSLDRNAYISANKITSQRINLKRMRELLVMMEDLNLLIIYKGFYTPAPQKSIDTSMRSILSLSTGLLDLFDTKVCVLFGTAREYDLVVLKDRGGKLIPIKGLRGISNQKAILRDMNKLLTQHSIKIQGSEVTNLLYKTVFHNSLQGGGRLYAGSFTTEKSELRKTITIDDQPTSEVDFKNMHLRILYNQYSTDFQDDAYEIDLPGYDAKELRTFCKKAMLVMLNADNKGSATRCLSLELRSKDKYRTISKKKGAVQKILQALEEKHDLLSDHFYQGEWDILQNLDSSIAKHIIKHFTLLGKVILPYHDSFVVKSEDYELLKTSMKEAWEMTLGTHHGFAVTTEYNN